MALHCVLSQADSEIPRTVALQAPLFMGFSLQEYWSGLLFPPQGILDLADTGTEPVSPALAGGFFTTLSHLESPRTYIYKEENQYTEMIARA